MVFYVFDFAVIVSVGFMVLCLCRFVQEARPRHTRLRERSQGIAQPLEVLKYKLTALL